MDFLQTLGFELLKIAALAAIYAAIIYCPRVWVSSRARRTWLRHFKYKYVCFLVGGSLLVFSFTYYGNHGLGDSYYLPIGHHKTMYGADTFAFFRTANSRPAMSVDSFLVRHDKLCMASEGSYYICYLPTGELTKFDKRDLYDQYALNNALPSANSFKDFESQYRHYWDGWRRWMLP